MAQTHNKLYLLLSIVCMAGYAWLAYSWVHTQRNETFSLEVCPVKLATGLPCPACGTTRSIIHITQGEIVDALHTNPLGFIGALALLLVPVWIVVDVLLKRDSLFRFYNQMEHYLKKPLVFLPLILLLLMNWIWNIAKGL